MILAQETTAKLQSIPSGQGGVIATLRLMGKMVKESKKSFIIRETARQIVHTCPQKNWRAEVECLFLFVRDCVRYTRDIRGVETLQTPEKTLEYRSGDCDDQCALLAALLESVGHPTRFVALGPKPGYFSHVIVETLIGRRWLPLDPTMPHPAGWYPPGAKSRKEHHN